jgi:hypothetical protein
MMSGFLAERTSGDPVPFVVKAPPDVKLGPDRTGTTTFTVTNLAGRPLRARMIPRGRNGAEDAWMTVVGDAEIPMGVAATVTVDVTVTVPPEAPGGQHLLVLEVVPEDDTETVIGQSVSFTAPPPKTAVAKQKKKRSWLRLVLIILFSLLALIGLAVVVLLLAITASGH